MRHNRRASVRVFRLLFGGVAALFILTVGAFAQAPRGVKIAGVEGIPGHPWSFLIPDPDTYDWSELSRPGYRYRGTPPNAQRFYDYIQQKRARGLPLTMGDELMIRHLIILRYWPEGPQPNAFWAAFMRRMRAKTTDELNLAERLMMAELQHRGLLIYEPALDAQQQKIVNYLKQGPYEARNWFERHILKAEDLLKWGYAARGVDLSPGQPASNVFPGEPFNGMQITYNVSGATLGETTDLPGFTTGRRIKGVIHTPGTLRISGVLRVGGYGADVTLRVWAGSQAQKKEFYISREGDPAGNPTSFDLSIPVPEGTATAGFLIRLDGRYSMGGGHRGLYVSGELGKSAAEKTAAQAAADAEWRRKVEETLAQLGYKNTPEGQALEEMRQALQGGEAAWKAYVNRQLARLGYQDDSPGARQLREIRAALNGGEEAWNQFVSQQLDEGERTSSGPPTSNVDGAGSHAGGSGTQGSGAHPPGGAGPALPDLGGLQVGTNVSNGQLQEPGDVFPRVPRVSTVARFQDLPEGSVAVATWTRDGQTVITSQRAVSGTGWVSFSLLSGDQTGLPPGRYTVTIALGDKILGRKTFTISGK